MSKKIIVEYLPDYKVKYTIKYIDITECEGGGWRSVVGRELACFESRVKFLKQIPEILTLEESLLGEEKIVFEEAKQRFEAGGRHAEWLKQALLGKIKIKNG